jgi:hypothetical protein
LQLHVELIAIHRKARRIYFFRFDAALPMTAAKAFAM